LSRMARLLSSMTWVARIAAPMATAMMASATKTSISVKPRCCLLDGITARRVAFDAHRLAARCQFQHQRIGNPLGAEHHRMVRRALHADRRRAPGLRAQDLVMDESVRRLRTVVLGRHAGRPAAALERPAALVGAPQDGAAVAAR